jgi:uncharacterized protein
MRRDVEFTSDGETVRGWLYTPDSGSGPYPAIVMAGGWCYVKELIQPHYADVFVEAGYACLIFDYRRLGSSDGQPRQHIDPWDQIEDYKNAISYVSAQPDIDADKIGIWGISYSGGHVLIVGATDDRVKCICSNIPVVDGYVNMRRVHGTEGFRALRALVALDRENRFQTGEYGYMPMTAKDHWQTVSTWPFPETNDVFNELKNTVAPLHEHRNTVMSVELLMNYSVFPFVERILNIPTIMVVADDDDLTLWDREMDAFQRIPCPNKQLEIIGATSHMALYSNLSRLQVAALRTADFLKANL